MQRNAAGGLFTKPSMDGLHGLEYLSLIVGYEGVYDLFDIAFHDGIQAVEGEIYPVISHPALGEVICPYPFAPVACPNHTLSGLGKLILLLYHHLVVKPCPEDLKGLC